MFFSETELYNASLNNTWVRGQLLSVLHGYDSFPSSEYRKPMSKNAVRKALRKAREHLLTRRGLYECGLGKWIRPWEIVPSLINWRPPQDDYGVGIEIEMGFYTIDGASKVVNHIKDWRYVAVDAEGGTNGVEATFAPVVYSKFGSKSQACRYTKFLSENQNIVVQHEDWQHVGTHVNVSSGNERNFVSLSNRVSIVDDYLRQLSAEEKLKYFGRAYPYGYCYNQDKYIEYKMFNSQTDWKRLRQYVDIAVEITALICDRDVSIDMGDVRAALERGFNKH